MRFVRVFKRASATDLALARTALEASEIPYSVEGENYFRAGGGLLSHGDTVVWIQVPQDQAEEARRLLAEHFKM